jgi:protocatechuate 3,4-dioxygenase beta subunit
MPTPKPSVLALIALPLLAVLCWLVYRLASGASDARGAPTMMPADQTPSAGPGPAEHAPDGAERAVVALPGAGGMLRILGRVLDPYGEPVAAALVGDAAAAQPTKTAADGRFELFVEAEVRPVALLVLAAGHAPLLSPLELPRAGTTHDVGDLQLPAAGSLRGLITATPDLPLPGATVALRTQAGGSGPAVMDLGALQPPIQTDAAGAFLFTGLAPGSYRVTATARGMQAAQSPMVTVREGAETTLDAIVMQAGYELSGTVVGPDDQPVADASVRIRSGGNQQRSCGEGATAADGRFSIDALPAGPLRLEVAKAGFLRHDQADVDPTRGRELVVRLAAGLQITGAVVDARTQAPVTRFALSVRRLGELQPAANGTMAQQLQRQIADLRATAATATDAAARADQLEIALQFEARLEQVRQWQRERPRSVPADPGPVRTWPDGRFSSDGLEEGLYAVGIASPDHAFAEQEPIELRRGTPLELHFALVAGPKVSGVVVARSDGSPVGGATVELASEPAAAAPEPAGQRSLYPWAFARGGPRGITVMAARTDADGRFAFGPAEPGRYFVSVRGARIADRDTEVFALTGAGQQLRIAVGARASLRGRIAGMPPGAKVEVLVLGGHGTLRTVEAAPDGGYRFDDLQPGSYLVRAFLTENRQYVNRLLGSIFPEHAGAVDPENVPPCDVTLGDGEVRAFDLRLDLPAAGSVDGRISINGRPAPGARATLRPVPGEAPGSGNLSLRANCDAFGRFAIRDVPAGKYTLLLAGASGQELHSEPVAIAPGGTVTVEQDLAAGGLRGRIAAADAGSPAELRGYVWVLPGAAAEPADLYEYRRRHRTHRVRVRDGVFEDLLLTPGPAVLVVDLRDRARTASRVVIPTGDALALDLVVAARAR